MYTKEELKRQMAEMGLKSTDTVLIHISLKAVGETENGADGMSKIFEEMGVSSLKSQYLLCTFATAMILCTALCAAKKQRLTAVDALFGLAIGVPNYFSTKFLLWSLGAVPAVVAYPTYSVGTIVMVTLAGVMLFREKLSRRKLIALGVIIAALALLNL